MYFPFIVKCSTCNWFFFLHLMMVCICSPLPLEANVSLDSSVLKDHGKWQNVPLVNTAPPLDSGPRQETVLLATTAPRVLPHPSRWTVRSAITVPQEVVSQNPVVTEPTDPPLGFSRTPSALPVTVVCTVTAPVSVPWLDPVTLGSTAPPVSPSPTLMTIDVHLGTTAWPIPALRSDVPVGSSRMSMKKTPVKSVQKVHTLPNSTKLFFEKFQKWVKSMFEDYVTDRSDVLCTWFSIISWYVHCLTQWYTLSQFIESLCFPPLQDTIVTIV